MNQAVKPRYIESKGLPSKKLIELALREGNSKLPVYRMHKWWARRLGSVVEAIILGLLLPDDTTEAEFWETYLHGCERATLKRNSELTLFDPFMGGGSSLVQARRLNLNCVGMDVDPMAWFVTRQELAHADLDVLQRAFEQVRLEAQPKIERYYRTIAEDGEQKDVTYYFWVRILKCPGCHATIELHPHYQLERRPKTDKQVCFCGHCYAIYELAGSAEGLICAECGTVTQIKKGSITYNKVHCSHCGDTFSRQQLVKEQGLTRVKLFALQYLERNHRGGIVKRFKRADQTDQALFRKAEEDLSATVAALPAIQVFLSRSIPLRDREDDRPVSQGFVKYADLFNARQIGCLAAILRAIVGVRDVAAREQLVLAFSDCLASNNMLSYYAFDYDKVTPLFGLHGYSVPTRPVENNVWGAALGRGTFRNCYAKVVAGLEYMSGSCHSTHRPQTDAGPSVVDVRRGSGEKSGLKSKSIDLILTDPPYFDNLNYGEMADFYYAWLRPILMHDYPREFAPLDCVTIQERIRGNGDEDAVSRFTEGLARVFAECRRVLKKDGLMALTFHHRRREPWQALHTALTEAGFAIVQITPVRSEGRGGFHSSPGNLKWDVVIVCRPLARSNSLCKSKFIDPQQRFEEWRTELGDVEGGPSQNDWRSLELALNCLGGNGTRQS